MSTDRRVAETILSQLGGNRFRVMTGAKNFAATDNSLRMRIGRNKTNANYMEVSLNMLDLYDITFAKVTKMGERHIENLHSLSASFSLLSKEMA